MVLFEEVQRSRQWWLVVAVVGAAAVGWTAWWQQVVRGLPFGSDPAPDWLVWALFLFAGVVLPVWAVLFRLVTRVDHDTVEVRFPPFRARRIAVSRILDVQVIEFRPVRDLGGYGYRRTRDGDVAFAVAGSRGVRVATGADERVVIGSQRPEALLDAIESARRDRPPPADVPG